MAKTWRQILDEMGKVSPEQTKKDKQEMLKEKGMTAEEFTVSREYLEEAMRLAAYRFSSPEVFGKEWSLNTGIPYEYEEYLKKIL